MAMRLALRDIGDGLGYEVLGGAHVLANAAKGTEKRVSTSL